MASLVYQKEAAALLLAVLGQNASPSVFDSVGNQIEKGQTTAQAYITSLLNSSAGQALYASKTDVEILQTIYTSVYGSSPSTAELQAILSGSSLTNAIADAVTSLLNYSGFDSGTLTSQTNFDAQLNNVLYPGTSAAGSGPGVSDALALYYLAGIDPVTSTVITLATQINTSAQTFAQVANKFVTDRAALNSLSNTDFINKVFTEAYERAPNSSEFSALNAILSGGGTKGDVLVNIITGLRGTVGSGDTAAQQFFLHDTAPDNAGQLAGLAAREQVASIYLAVPQRDVDAQGLDDWSNYLGKHGNTFSSLTAKLLTSVEFQKKGAQLTGNDFIQHVYTAVHGVAATSAQLALYSGLTDKAAITDAIINDLRNSTATDNTTVAQQHAFEYDIGTSLVYKTAASLTTTAAGGNATGTVNTNSSHVLSNAETAVLTNIQLNANAAATVNLAFADHLANLTINGTGASIVSLSTDGVNPGVDITVNNGNVVLNGSSGNDTAAVTSTANLATGTAKFNLGDGNDSLTWGGNAAAGAANIVGSGVQANGGNGIDTISANFITKNVTTVASGIGGLGRTTTFTTNASNFTNFEKIDLAGYIGKATATDRGNAVTTADHTFDFGILTGNATTESSVNAGSLVQAGKSNIGSQGFVLSGLASAVKVINAAGGDSAQLEVTGNATSASSVDITFLQNATDHFNVNFTASGTTDINAGSLSLNSSSSLLFPTALSTINIASGGTGAHGNILNLAGSNSQVSTIFVTGDHHLDLTVAPGYSNLLTLDASGNTGGINVVLNQGGTGQGVLYNLLALLPLGSTLATLLGLGGTNFSLTGSSAADSFTVLGNTTITGGTGANDYHLVSSTTAAGVTINDFNSAQDSIVDSLSGLTISATAGTNNIADYGVRTESVLGNAISALLGGILTGVVGALGSLLGIGGNDALGSKVGVVGVERSGGTDSYIIIDNNNDHKLDANDSVIYLKNTDHQNLIDTLHYASTVTLNGIAHAPVAEVA
ncbi:beta strand repeat-containing protein [Serratia sp. IR-2025]